MKKKIIGIFVCMLLIATALPAVGLTNIKEIETTNDPSLGVLCNVSVGNLVWEI